MTNLATSILRRCGSCFACRAVKRQEWAGRILLENNLHDCAVFLTLTHNQESVPADYSIEKDTLTKFLHRLRTNARRMGYRKKLRYFACGEYGEEYDRPHYHAVVFGMHSWDRELLDKTWSPKELGNTTISNLTQHRAAYVARYTQKKLHGQEKLPDGRVPPFASMSRKPALGSGMAKQIADGLRSLHNRQLSFINQGGHLEKDTWRLEINGVPGFHRCGKKTYPLGYTLRSKIYRHLDVGPDDQARIDRDKFRASVYEWHTSCPVGRLSKRARAIENERYNKSKPRGL